MEPEASMLKAPSPAGVIDFDAAATIKSGEIVAVPDGRLGVRLGLKDLEAGDRVAVAVRGQARINQVNSSTSFDAGDVVGWHTTNNEAVAVGAGGSVELGIALHDSGGNGRPVVVGLNEHPTAPAGG